MANLNLNKVILGGRITKDIELKQTQSGISVVSFSIAVNRQFVSKNSTERQADFINCVAWRTTAEFISKYFRKGSSICVTGSIQTRQYDDKDGNKRTATEVVIDEAMFVDAKGESPANTQSVPYPNDAPPAPAYSTPQTEAPNFSNVEDDDDLPF